MSSKYYPVYSHRFAVPKNFTRQNKRKDTLGLLPVVRDLNNGAEHSESDHINNQTRKDDSICDTLSSPFFRIVICVVIVVVILIYKSDYFDYFHSKNEKSSKLILKTSWNYTKMLYDDEGKPQIEVIEILPNCGLQTICSENAFPVHIYTGKNKTDFPKLCIMGKYVMSFNRTLGGRGINVAVIEPETYTILAVNNFDTYEYNSSNLDVWLQNMFKIGHIIIFFTFDEASKKLTKKTRNMLYKMGSGKIQDLRYRCQWYLVTQMGIQGISPYEKITYSHKNNWAEVLDERLCIPFNIPGNPILVDDLTNNQQSFCNNATLWTEELSEFCNESNKH